MPSIYRTHPGGRLEADFRLGRARQNHRALRLWPTELLFWQAERKAELEMKHQTIIIFHTGTKHRRQPKHWSYKSLHLNNALLSQMKLDEVICV